MSFYKSNRKDNSFKTSISKFGLSKPNRFDILISNPSGNGISNMTNSLSRQRYLKGKDGDELIGVRCESIDMPGKTLRSVAEENVYGPSYEIPQGMTFTNSIEAVFLLDRNLFVKRYFDAWQDSIHDANNFNMNYYNEYVRDMIIRQLDEQDVPVYSCRVYEVYPKTVELISLSNESRSQVSKLNVSFAFRYWEEEDSYSQFNPTAIVSDKSVLNDEVV